MGRVREELPLDDRPLTQPARQRLPADQPGRDRILAAHTRAVEAGESMYPDPVTGLFVLTARFLAERGSCCSRGCRHCPYVRDEAADGAPGDGDHADHVDPADHGDHAADGPSA